MQFNSIVFAIFFPLIFVLYWVIGRYSLRAQNIFLLLANCGFYAWWDYRFLLLLLSVSIVDYYLGIKLEREEKQKQRRVLLAVSLIVNLGLLGFFKYFNFFLDSFTGMTSMFGMKTDLHTMKIILPLGISFYTLQRLSYPLDLYRKQIPASRDWVAFTAFTSFFPLMAAGPIERAKRMMPQFQKIRIFNSDKAKDGLRQILWGFFKKVVIADNLVDPVGKTFKNYLDLSGVDLACGVFLFAVQIYCDFSAYSDIAIGCGRLLGFRIIRNFAYPYFSRDIGEFWRRWHVALSTWFRDYIYTPLSWHTPLNKSMRRMWNLILTFTASGLWHGANWTFVVWGALNGLYFIPLVFRNPPERQTDIIAEGKLLPSLRELMQMMFTFIAILFAWIFFRAESLQQALLFIRRMFTHSWFTLPEYWLLLLFSFGFLLFEWFQREKQYALEIGSLPMPVRWSLYYGMILIYILFGDFGSHEFFYVQF